MGKKYSVTSIFMYARGKGHHYKDLWADLSINEAYSHTLIYDEYNS